ncbi:type I-E CRISPR-associated protein Cas6/Cse3/CasE [Rhodospirillum rubrum]|uniref:CRISPR-associated protein, CT1974 family n=1 Tax=Rhodospirillum rubrum (strain ATCC 11170 / ATH 1.1.1 / DSM 467 / LMG 4362 / NCIMB 8255 / S1) TaxID=269796 RepID=Q2RXJ4_RHORT|nr:type I-E CRISPR-associated protein Cas6/Cse3/CasE [Rhodospirillum rubrum]ABC21151.1 CRISPR-associated protein, CT1974 family [Rhodospirillum rubrum ATCC 11170]AEO46822.1 CRISPR-associated Cse3 family protein [Rhodospirillum rubrum F11]MBK5952699.1 CRISPR-associated protein Cse3 [Rhodospirillum rubrum]QXG80842.1 type I-E CRISPR-associated protein Cas6/Cse3/CasE [Rhodospirillum rubrum]HAP98569.1 type I-E CRISPR-associated protein Cas6/Cse3/CasE [Rhodospirillum rubrum]
MTPLYLISLPLDMVSFHRWAGQRGIGTDEGRALHHLLGESFGKGVLQPFRLMVAPNGATGTLYAYTRADRTALVQTTRDFGLPDALAVCDPARLAAKAMPEDWREGRRLAFDLRARPVRRLLKPAGVFPKGAEVDAFLLEALRRFPEGRPAEGVAGAPITREGVYFQWLAERLSGAARVEEVRLARFERRAVLRGSKSIEGPDAVFHGELVILDGAKFAGHLASGLGRHTAYGYGMMLLRPAR